MKRHIKTILLATTVLSGGLAENAVAQDADDDAIMEQILVTATKRVTSLQRTPIAITAVSGASIDRNNVNEFNDIADIIPNFQSVRQGDQTATFCSFAASAR